LSKLIDYIWNISATSWRVTSRQR